MRKISLLAAVLALLGGACTSPKSGSDEPAGAGDDRLPEVRVAQPIRTDLERMVRVPGHIEAFEKAELYAKAGGYLKRIFVDKGDRVREGQVLAELDVPEMIEEAEEIKARLTEARADAELKRLTFERLSSVRDKEPELIPQHEVDVARADLERALAAASVAKASQARLKAMMDYSFIKAPFSGIVTERYVDPGALIQSAATTRQATPVVTVMNMSTVRVYVHVPEREVAHVREGIPAEMEVDALSGRRFESSVTRFTSALDPATRTMKVEIDIPNPDGALMHGMYGMVTLRLGERTGALTVPAESLVKEGGAAFVLSVVNGVIVKRDVTTGMDDGQTVEVVTGLTGDEQVVVGDRSGLEEGMKVSVRVQ